MPTTMSTFLRAVFIIWCILHYVTCNPTTSMNGRKVVLMSMDGFRYDYFSKANTTNFDALKASGVTVPYVNNTFTTMTFPNHYSIVTGLYEESHGIVNNKMYDPVLKKTFRLSSTESDWWEGAEPIWINAVKNGLKVGIYFWPGSEAEIHGFRPTNFKKYDGRIPYKTRIDTLIDQWLSDQDMDLGLIYFEEPDKSGHKYGPDAPEMISVIESMDALLGYFLQKLEEKNLREKVDLIVTSDHGMTETDPQNKAIYLDDYTNKSLVLDVVYAGAFAHLRPQEGKARDLVAALSGVDHMKVYVKEDIPEHFHYKNNRRITPVVAIADEGWIIRNNKRHPYTLNGTHGYSNEYASMKPMFVASGPSFRKGVEAEPISSLDIYPLMCHLLSIKPAPNNGSFERVKPFLRPADPNLASSITISFHCVFLILILHLFTK